MKTKQELSGIIKEQLAIEYNCLIEDFSSSNNIITVAQNNAVITADECIHEWLKEFTKNKEGHWLFEHNNLIKIDEKLKEHNKKSGQTYHMFLSYRETIPKDINFRTEWFENKALYQFYTAKMFPNALCKEYDLQRPDVLAVAVYDGDRIIGMAGCSADTPLLWQIGIDVNEYYRGKGIGTYLVTLIKNETEKRGKIPFYGTSLSNLRSWGIALSSGFFPVWIEIASFEKEE